MDYEFFAFLSVILLSTQLLGRISKKIKLPAVVGALIAGILLGPSALNWVRLGGASGGFITMSAEIGVVLLMFTAGLETDLKELKNNLFSSLIVAILGIFLPLLCGFFAYLGFFREGLTDYNAILKTIFMGVILTATSVSITVETLREMGKLRGKVATTILGAAVIDDVLGVVVLSVITSLKDPATKISTVFFNIFWFSLSVAVIWVIITILRKHNKLNQESPAAVAFSLVLCFLLAWMSEDVYQIADVTGAYFAGLILSQLKGASYIEKQCKTPLNLFFSPIFFASVGLKVSLSGMTMQLWVFSIVLLVIAIFSKIVGCGLGAQISKYSWKDSLRIGVGMMARGEVALIMAQKGLENGLLPENLFSPVVIVVMITTLLAPIILSFIMEDKCNKAQAIIMNP